MHVLTRISLSSWFPVADRLPIGSSPSFPLLLPLPPPPPSPPSSHRPFPSQPHPPQSVRPSLLYSVFALCLCAGFTCGGQGRRCVGGSRCAPNELSFTFLTCPLADQGCFVAIWWLFNRHSSLHLLSIRDDVSTYILLFTHPIVPWWRFNQHSILRLLSNPDDVLTYTQLFTRLTVIWWRFNEQSVLCLCLLSYPDDILTYTQLFVCSLLLIDWLNDVHAAL